MQTANDFSYIDTKYVKEKLPEVFSTIINNQFVILKRAPDGCSKFTYYLFLLPYHPTGIIRPHALQ